MGHDNRCCATTLPYENSSLLSPRFLRSLVSVPHLTHQSDSNIPLAFLLALWTLICNICHGLALWGGVSQAFWATWPYLPFGSFFLKILPAPWTLIHNICLTLWDGVSQAFWPAWTYSSFESFLPKLPLAPWTLMYNNCLALRDGVSQAFQAA